jgi:hypothetical protein
MVNTENSALMDVFKSFQPAATPAPTTATATSTEETK